MLPNPADFPHSGAKAFLRAGSPHGADEPLPVRIIQHNAGTCLIAIEERWGRATTNRTVAMADLVETEAEATHPAPTRKRARA